MHGPAVGGGGDIGVRAQAGGSARRDGARVARLAHFTTQGGTF
jgi:hypothetical protein